MRFFLLVIIFLFIGIVLSDTEELQSILILPNSTYSAHHINLQWTLPDGYSPLAFQFKTSSQKEFVKTPIFELFERTFSINITSLASYNGVDTNLEFDFRILIDSIDNRNEVCEWFNIYVNGTGTDCVVDYWWGQIGKLKKYRKYPLYALGGAGLGIGAVGVATIALPLAGFTAGGIAAGSWAAGIQSSIGLVGGASYFAAAQSAGAAGFAASTHAIFGGIGLVGGITRGIMELLPNRDNHKSNPQHNDTTESASNEYKERQNDNKTRAVMPCNDDLKEKLQFYDAAIQSLSMNVEEIQNTLRQMRTTIENQNNQMKKCMERVSNLEESKEENNDLTSANSQPKQQANQDYESVKNWLKNEVNLERYYALFIENGFEDLESIQSLNMEILNMMQIEKIGHKIKILRYVAKLNHPTE